MTNLRALKFADFKKNERQYYAFGVLVAVVVLFSLLIQRYENDNKYLKNQNELLIQKNDTLQKKIIEILKIKNQ